MQEDLVPIDDRPVGLLGCQRRVRFHLAHQLPKQKPSLSRRWLFHPQRSIVVKGGNPIRNRNETQPALLSGFGHERNDRIPSLASAPTGQKVDIHESSQPFAAPLFHRQSAAHIRLGAMMWLVLHA
ncbi:MAG: hypothetical protein ACERJ2_09685, partial [Filomicrobium sp.]